MGFFDKFLPKEPQQAAPVPPTPAPAQEQQQQQPKGSEFENLWKLPEPPAPNEQPKDPYAYENFLGAAGKVDFISNMPAELKDRINAGGEEAFRAMQEALNFAAQQAFAQSTYAATQLSKQLLDKERVKFQSELPSLMSRHSAKDALLAEYPELARPEINPLVEAVQQRLAVTHRDASKEELAKLVKNYFVDVVIPAFRGNTGGQTSGNQVNQGTKSDPSVVDWSNWMSK